MGDHVLDNGLYAEQERIERESRANGIARYRRLVQEAVNRGDGAALKPAERLLVHWFTLYRNAIANEKRQITQGKPRKGRVVYGPYLIRCNTAKVALIAMHHAVGGCMANFTGVKSIDMVLEIGRAINADCNYRWMRRHKGGITADAWGDLVKTSRKQFKSKIVNRVANRHQPGARWALNVQTHLGARLIELLMDVATINDLDGEFKPAFHHFNRSGKGRTVVGHVRLTFEAMDLIEQGHLERERLATSYRPMVVPPLAWKDGRHGGYLTTPFPIMKFPGYYRQHCPVAASETAVEALNAISATPWRINQRILAVVKQLAAQGGNIAGIPRLFSLPKPPIPPDFDTNIESKKIWKRKAVDVRRANLQALAEAVCFNFKLDIAEQMSRFERIYYPHQFDFRTRNYPVPLHLNHQADDVCRGLMEFAEAKTPGPAGRRWLRIHLANCCGVDKVSMDERLKWVDDNWPTMELWLSDPLEYTGWMEADKPWQALATAWAIADPEAGSHLPIQMDGSNNALQHFAAMLRCEQTAALTNLIPCEAPADVYSRVADEVSVLVGKDADKGHEIAKLLDGWIDRKIVKQTVMTTSYGVTHDGARRQLYEHLSNAGFVYDNLFSISSYLARHCIAGTQRTCRAAYEAMKWLETTARAITATGEPIRWTTPLGVEIEQPYRNSRIHNISTMFQRLQMARRTHDCPISVSKQVRGLSPNFVHSIDASHLMCTAIACRDNDMRFAGVHDAAWTHAADADNLGRILREQFILIHEEPALWTLAEEFRRRYPEAVFDDPPATGDFNISQVMEATYAFC